MSKARRCPVCGSVTSVGHIGVGYWYCTKCEVQFSIRSGKVRVYRVTEDGELKPMRLRRAVSWA